MEQSTNQITPESKLFDSLEMMHCLASGSLSRIRGIAKCALRSLETDTGARDLEAIAEALKAIVLDADMTHNDVGCEAEEHGIQTIDEGWSKRLTAMANAARFSQSVMRGDAS